MKARIVIYAVIVSLLSSCNNQIKEIEKTSNNLLLAEKVQAKYFFSLTDTSYSKEWQESFDKDYLFKNTFNQIINNNFKVYDPNGSFSDTADLVEKEEVMRNLGWDSISNDYSELYEILFLEEWNVDTNLKSFIKIVKKWCPIRSWYIGGDKDRFAKKKVVYILPEENKRGKLICKDVYSSDILEPYSRHPIYTGLDKIKFIESVFKKIEKKEIIVYDPIHIIDKSQKPYSVEDIEKNIGYSINSRELIESISSFLFIEDWYFDKESLCIYKEVKSMAFVQWRREEQIEKILFFIKFE